MRVVLLNKDSRQKLKLAIPSKHGAKLWRMEAPDLTATAGVTLAGTEIRPGEAWKPHREERIASKGGVVRVTLQAASGAALLFDHHPG